MEAATLVLDTPCNTVNCGFTCLSTLKSDVVVVIVVVNSRLGSAEFAWQGFERKVL